MTGSLERVDARTFEMVYQKEGKTLSFTETSTNKADPPLIAVYERQ